MLIRWLPGDVFFFFFFFFNVLSILENVINLDVSPEMYKHPVS